eukprot:gene2917-5730_t
MSSINNIPESVIQIFFRFLTDVDYSSFGTISKHFATFDEVWQGLFIHRFGYHGSLATRTRRGLQPRHSFFLALRGRRKSHSIIGHLLFLSIQKHDSPKEIKGLLPHDFPFNLKFDTLDSSTLLCLASRYKRWKILKMLINDYSVDINICDARGMSALIYASWHGDVNIVKFILNTKNQQPDIFLQGSPIMTSACGGKGPYTAEVWASRKAIVCPEILSFQKIASVLKKKRILSLNDVS